MFSIFFYIGPKLAEFEAVGFPTKRHAIAAVESTSKVWFTNEGAEEVFIPLSVRKESVAVIKETA